MPRWLWITLAASLLLLAWVGLHQPDTTQFTQDTASVGSANGCPLPKRFSKPDKPLQTALDNRIEKKIQMGDSSITPLAGFSLRARVLSRENYYIGNGADYSPTDLALGWGPMAEAGMAKKLNITQSGRWYRYSWGSEGPALDQSDIVSNSANMHMVPANNTVANALGRVSANDMIELNGWLIRIEKNDGWRWQSSLSREDSGDGACELVYVCSIEVKN